MLEQLPFFSGYGVETGLLIDVFERFGLRPSPRWTCWSASITTSRSKR